MLWTEMKMEVEKWQKEMRDEFCILLVFLIALAFGMVFGYFYFRVR